MRYQPSNGTESFLFMRKFCFRCIHDEIGLGAKGVWCSILGRTSAFKVEDAKYPEEWTYDENGEPICTAFAQATLKAG